MTDTAVKQTCLALLHAMTSEQVFNLALQHLLTTNMNKSRWQRYYQFGDNHQQHNVKAKRYYYKKNDIYHPELHPSGLHERKYKREALQDL